MMPNVAELLEREGSRVDLEPGHFERLVRRRDRKRRNQRIRAGALAVVLALVTFAALTRAFSTAKRPASPLPTPIETALRGDGEVIKYTGDDARSPGALVAQDPDTGEMRTLVDERWLLANAVRPGYLLIGRAAWSADRRWVAFDVTACGGGVTTTAGKGGIWVTNGVDEPRQLTKPCENRAGDALWAWSPSGSQLVVLLSSIDGGALVLIDPATGHRTNLGKTADHVTALAWSPDGTRIAYASQAGDAASSPWSLYSVGVGGGHHSLLESAPGVVWGASIGGYSPSGIVWSSDGAHIVVQAAIYGGRGEAGAWSDILYVMNADGSDLRRLARGQEVQSIDWRPGLAWSPDGTRMAYATYSGGPDERKMQIWNESPDGSTRTLVFESKEASEPPNSYPPLAGGGPVWSPDGQYIAFEQHPSANKAAWLVASADGTGDVRQIDELHYLSLLGGSYLCGCYG
jgi:Tol biopolymer transport system component